MGYLHNIKKLYGISLFHSLIPAYVIERLFWQQRGMDVQRVVYCEMIYALTVTLCEIPSGILADRLGRKKLFLFANALAVAELLLLFFAQGFGYFAAAMILAGIGKALSSGSENALLYDSLTHAGQQHTFEKHLGRIFAIDFAGSVIAALSGAVLASAFGMAYNYLLSIASMCAAFIMTLFLREPPILKEAEEKIPGKTQYLRQSLDIFRRQPLVLLYCVTGAVLGACMIYLDEFWQLVMDSIGTPVLFWGVISALMLCARIPGNLIAYKLKEKVSFQGLLMVIVGLNAIGYAAIFFVRNIYCLIPMLALCLMSGALDPLILGYLHHHTQSAVRATVESFSSLGLRVVSAGVGWLFGWIIAAHSLFAGFLLLSVICLGYLIFCAAARPLLARRAEKRAIAR